LQPGGEQLTEVSRFGEYSVIPAASGGFASLSKKLDNIMGELEQLPLNETIANLNELIDSTDETMVTTRQSLKRSNQTLDALEQTMQELQSTLSGLQPDSQVYRSVEQVMLKVEATLDELKPLVKEVTNQPNSLVFGQAAKPDEEPVAPKKDKE
jgi:paraquat-inducible protein B